MSRRALGALLLATLVVATAGGAWAWWRAWSAPRVAVVLRPTYSVEGISTGTPVRVNGVVVGQVESLGLRPDAEGRLRPEVRLTIDPSDLEDRGFADRLRRDRLSEEVARGLRARLITVSPASGLLQVELLWEEPSPPPAGLASDEIPAAGGSKQRALERVARELGVLAGRDLAQVAAELEADLDAYLPKSDPARAARLSADWVAGSAAFAEATDDAHLGAQAARLIAAVARLREGAAQAETAVDAETLARLQVRLADAREAVRAFGASLEGSGRSLESAQAEAATVLRDLSEGARTWTRKARGLTTEPLPPAR
ncbi:MAG: MlaD protein [Verrucomicrobiota bacterium]|jgi:hypothetical protein